MRKGAVTWMDTCHERSFGTRLDAIEGSRLWVLSLDRGGVLGKYIDTYDGHPRVRTLHADCCYVMDEALNRERIFWVGRTFWGSTGLE